MKAHRNWMICENYTPNGVVVVVDVVATKDATEDVVVKTEAFIILLFIIHFKSTILNELKKWSLYFCEYHNFRQRLFLNDFI